MINGQPNEKLNIRLKIVVLAFFLFLTCFFFPNVISKRLSVEVEAQTSSKNKRKPEVKTTPTPQVPDYSNFSHNTHLTLKLACDACHKVPTANWDKVRPKDSAFQDVTDFPKHESCVGCHRQQFFFGKPPTICANCHINPSPNDSSRHPFPNPREIFDLSPKGKTSESEFQVHFSHEIHVELVSRNENPFEGIQNGVSFIKAGLRRGKEDSCKVCHQTYQPQGKSDVEFVITPPKDLGEGFWLKKGTFKTAPIGHTNCFSCHSTDTGIAPAPTDCATCHKIKPRSPIADFDKQLAEKIGVTDKITLQEWKRRDSSGKFQHEFFGHVDLECATCHNATKIDTLDVKTKKVAVTSCAPCHITPTTDDGGALNYEVDSKKKDAKFECVKCHITFGKSEIPTSHIKAISDLGKGN